MLRGHVEWCREEGHLAGNAADMNDDARLLAFQEVRDGELGHADGVCQVDVHGCVAGFGCVVDGRLDAHLDPEVGEQLYAVNEQDIP